MRIATAPETEIGGSAPALETVRVLAYHLPMMILALILASAQADPAEPLVTAYGECLIAQARRLDDGRSDAATVAQIVRLECRDAEDRAARALSGDDAFENREAVVAQIKATGLSRAIRAVLRVRTAK